jgi:hypothetical protein
MLTSERQTMRCGGDADPGGAPKTCSDLAFIECPRQDSNLRPSAPEADPTRLPGSTAVHGMPTLGPGTCCLTCGFRPQRSITVHTRP